MPLNEPVLDHRDYADILQDALARIPVHNPTWTNFNDSDPGVTMIQLFAFMTESILYRANQIPERNRLKFLNLLGIPLRPAAAAHGFVTLNNARGPLETRTFPAGIDVRAGQVRFQTTQGMDVLPLEARFFYKQALPTTTDEDMEREKLYSQLYADLLDDTGSHPAFYQTTPLPQPKTDGVLPVIDLNQTVDGCLWLALLARPGEDPTEVRNKIANKTLTVGVMPKLEENGVVVEAGQATRAAARPPLHWEIIRVTGSDRANYQRLEARPDGFVLDAPGLVELTLPSAEELTWDLNALEPGLEGTGEFPPSLADTNIRDRVVTWLRLRIEKKPGIDPVKARLSWVDINATMVEQKVTVTGEVVGAGNGEPDQCFRLANTPILPGSLVLTVKDQAKAETWHRIDDILAADPEVPVNDPRWPIFQTEAAISPKAEPRSKVYTLNPESGEICTGDGVHGARPKPGQRLVAAYAFGGGRQGNVGIGMINRSPQLPAGFKVNNPLRTWGGEDRQAVAVAEKTVARAVRHRDRLVAVPDFIEITTQTPGVDIGRVEVLPLFDPSAPEAGEVPGVVTILVIPNSPDNNAPKPDQFFLEAVCDHLQPRRLITTELHVRGPDYVDIWLSIGIETLGGYAIGPVREAVKAALFRFLSPLVGGHSQTGWPLNIAVLTQEIEAVVSRVDGVRLVNEVLLGIRPGDDALADTIEATASVPVEHLMLPRLMKVVVAKGPPIELNQLLSAPAVVPAGRWTSIPVLPEQC